MDFISRTPPDCYFLVPVNGNMYYGMVLSEDTVEYLTNEFTVHRLEIVDSVEVRKILTQPGCKIFGNKDLIDF
jgi:hypothetical protein